MRHQLNEVWIKASVAGTIWAAAEIVLGSFLHNLKVPFTGNILTAIGMMILISFSHVWKEKGLFWRAGLVCSLMKSMSPSAVIFGPMIAIFAESLILEFFTRITARHIAGYLLGAMVAMSWNLFQKIVNYIIFYGGNIIGVYTNLLNMAQKQLRIETDLVWLPIFLFLGINLVFGFLAGVAGIRAGRRLQQGIGDKSGHLNNPVEELKPGGSAPFSYSLVWLAVNLFLMVTSFLLLIRSSPLVWIPVITAVTLLWAIRYKRAFRKLSKPRFWIFFIFITLLAAFVFTRAGGGEITPGQALMTGIKMNFRALVIITGFTVLGTELYNPVVRNFFMRTSARNLPLALELSAESLPFFVANIPDLKTMFREPGTILQQFLTHAEERIEEIRIRNQQRVCIITGGIEEGKTTLVKQLLGYLKENGIPVGGVISERVITGGITTGYDLVQIDSGERWRFLRTDGECDHGTLGRFSVCGEALLMGNTILQHLANDGSRLIVIDEVGRFELQGEGWAPSLDLILSHQGHRVVMTVRNDFLEEVTQRWNLGQAEIVRVQPETDISSLLPVLEKMGITAAAREPRRPG